MKVEIMGQTYSEDELLELIKAGRRWHAFRNAKITSIEFEDMAQHTFHGPPMPEEYDSLADYIMRKQYNDAVNSNI